MAMLIEDHVQFREEHKLLLSAQVLLTERVDKLLVVGEGGVWRRACVGRRQFGSPDGCARNLARRR